MIRGWIIHILVTILATGIVAYLALAIRSALGFEAAVLILMAFIATRLNAILLKKPE